MSGLDMVRPAQQSDAGGDVCFSVREGRIEMVVRIDSGPADNAAKVTSLADLRCRCLVPASSYFERKSEGSAKQPYFIHDSDGELLVFAGLWESWRETKESEPLYTYTIVTGPPGLVSGDIHDERR